MADNIFATDPYSAQLDAEETALTGRNPRQLPNPAPKPDAKQGLATLEAFEDIAIKTNAPVNVLMAVAEAKGASDLDHALAIANATALSMSRQMAQGESVEDIMAGEWGDQASAVLDRARALDAEIYGDTPKAPLSDNNDNSTVEDMSRQVIGSVVSGAGSILEGTGRLIQDAVLPDLDGGIEFIKDADGNTVGHKREVREGYLSSAAERAGDTVRGWGKALKDGVSKDAKDAMAASSPDGDLFKPSTWTMGESPSLYGITMLGADVLGSFLPVVAAAALGGPGAGLVVGGAQGAGAGSEQAREVVREAANDIGEDGKSQLERESAFYREAVARGMNPAEALAATEEAASATAALLTAPISAFGGAATGKILTGGAKAVARRGTAARVVGTAGLSALEEGLQEAAEGIATRYGTGMATGLDISATEGSFGDFVLGALGGTVPGAVSGALTPRLEDSPDDKSDLEADIEPGIPGTDAPIPGTDGGSPISEPGTPPALDPDQPMTGEMITEAAMLRMAELRSLTQGSTAPDGTVIPPDPLSPEEAAEYRFLSRNAEDPAALARFMELPYAAERAEPKGPLEDALDATAPAMFPDLGKDAPVELVSPDGEVFEGIFVGETPNTINVQIGKDVIEVPRTDFESGLASLKPLTAADARQNADIANFDDSLIDDQDFLNGENKGLSEAEALEQASEPASQPASPALPDIQPVTEAIAGTVDYGEDGTVDVNPDGPWDFATSFPSPDVGKINDQLTNGRSDSTLTDPAGVVEVLRETLPDALDRRLEAAEWLAIAEDIEDGAKPSFPGLKRGTKPEEAAKIARDRSDEAMKALEDIEGTLRDIWPDSAVDDMAAFINAQALTLEREQAPAEPTPAPEPASKPASQKAKKPKAKKTDAAPETTQDDKDAAHQAVSTGIDFQKMNGKRARKVLTEAGVPEPSPERIAEMIEKAGVVDSTQQGQDINFLHVDSESFKKTGIAPYTASDRLWARVNLLEQRKLRRKGKFLFATPEFLEELRGYEQARKLASQQANNPTEAELDKAAAEADPNPTDAQKEAENYKMGHIRWNGLDISIESAKGTERSGTDPDGNKWSVKMPAHYGRIKGTLGADGDHVDVYLGQDAEKTMYVQIIDQKDADSGAFDEHKVIIGAGGKTDGDRLSMAKELYNRGFSDGRGPDRMGAITEMSIEDFKAWLEGDTTKPVGMKEERARRSDGNETYDLSPAERATIADIAEFVGGYDATEKITKDAERYGGLANLAFVFDKYVNGKRQERLWVNGDGNVFSRAVHSTPKAVLDRTYYDTLSAYIRVDADFDPKELFGNTTKPDDLATMFDEVVDAEFDAAEGAGEPEPTPEPASEPASQQASDPEEAWDGASNTEREDMLIRAGWTKQDGTLNEAASRNVDRDYAELTPTAKKKVAQALGPAPRTAGEAAKSAAANTAGGFADIAKGLGELFASDPTKLNAGLTFDEDTYAKAKPYFIAGFSKLAQATTDAREVMVALVRELMAAGMTREQVKNMGPYATRFVEEVQAGKIEIPAETDTLDGVEEDQPNDNRGNDANDPEPLEGAPRGEDQGVEPGGADGAGESTGDAGGSGDTGAGRSGRRSSDRVERRAKPDGPESTSLASNPAGSRTGDRPTTTQGTNPGNFQIAEDFPLGQGTPGQKIKANLAAIRLAQTLEAENRFATPAEQKTLAAYVGWGGLRGAFDVKKEGGTDQFGRANAELRELLTPEEYEQAFLSTRNAHYTAREIVSSMWDAMRHFGFTGGRVLEPTVGTGNFLGLQPAEMAASSDWYAAEMDPVTGLIAKHLYPEAKIMDGTPFEKANFLDGVFDVAIGNPPFGSNVAKDPKRPDLDGMKIHNYVIAKSGLHLRPGGIMAMVVTHRFLDTADPQGRAELAKRFKMLGAIRLPNDAFAATAGTEVTTDIVIMQKLQENEKPDLKANWLNTDGDLDGIRVNAYFAANPTHILGRSAMDGTMYGSAKEKGEYTVHGDGRDLKAAINDVITTSWADLAGALGTREATLEGAVVAATSEANLRIGGMTVRDDTVIRREMDDAAGNQVETEITAETFWTDDGPGWEAMLNAVNEIKEGTKDNTLPTQEQIDMVEAASSVAKTAAGGKLNKPNKAQAAIYDVMEALGDRESFQWTADMDVALELIEGATDRQRLGQPRLDRIKALLELRALSHAQINAEMTDAPNIEANRKALNKAYDAFVKDHGLVSDPQNLTLMQGDIGLEMGLESRYEPAVPAQKADVEAGLAAVPRKKASAEKSGMLLKRVSFPHRVIEKADSAADALGISLSERGRVDLPYMASLVGKTTKDVIAELTSGDTPRLFFDPELEAYVDAEEYLSGNVRYKLDEARKRGMGANIKALEAAQPEPLPQSRVTPSVRSQWIPPEIFQDFLADLGVKGPSVSILSSLGRVTVSGTAAQPSDLGLQFRHPDKNMVDIFQAAAMGKSITIRRTVDKKSYVDEEATKSANALVARMGKVFEEWAYSDQARADQIVDAFNEKLNTHKDRSYDGVKYLNPVGANPTINLRRTQKDGAWRMVLSNSVLLDHVVGAGKTFTAITGIMERRRLGLSRKPMVVVPNHLVLQWASDFYALYPGAQILAATPADFTAKNRKRMFARIASGDYDAVIIGHSSLGYIENPVEDVRELLTEKKADLKAALDEARKNKESGRSLTQIANRIEKYDQQLNELLNRNRDDVGFDFEDMGIDHLTVDESQEFKNLEYATGAERVVGMNDPKGSQKAFDLYVKARGLRRRGGGTVFATGTPVSNSLVEVYTVMNYLAAEELKKRNLQAFDAWSAAYATTETRMEYTATQKLKPRRVLSSLNNLTSLGQLYRQFADTITMKTLKELYAEEMAAQGKPTSFPVPKVATGGRQLDSAPLSDQQARYMDYLVARMQKIEQNGGNKEYMKIDNALWVLSDARKMSLDIRTVDPTAERDDNGKVARAARRIKDTYDRWADDKGTQMVFSDLSTPSKAAVSDAKKVIRATAEKLMGTTKGRAHVKSTADQPYVKQWRALEAAWEEMQADDSVDGDTLDAIEEHFAGIEDAEASMTTADVGFSVYDDLRAALIDDGIPANEIAFIHDYNDPKKKQRLFTAMNRGDVRVLIGSSAKMGAGTNAQERLVALHHMDAPWRPSDVEQREGRIIRQGNALYQRDPDNFEVDIHSYSTEGSSDTVLWQILERKSAGIETFRQAADMDSLAEGENDSDQYAEFMASSTGNPVFRYKLEAERLETELRSETSGQLMARNSAKRFMAEYPDRLARLEDRIAALSAAKPGPITYKGTTGDPAELQRVLEAAQQAYEADYATWLEKKAEEDAARDPLLKQGMTMAEATTALRKAKKLAGGAPVRPNVSQEAIQKKSGYARAMHALLSDIGSGAPNSAIDFKVGNMELRIERNKPMWTDEVAVGRYTVTMKAGQLNLIIDTREGKDPAGMPGLRNALMPEALGTFVRDELEYRQDNLADIKARKPRQKELAALEIDRKPVEAAARLREWYTLSVNIAENAADIERGARTNEYITADTKRALGGFKGFVKGEERRVDFEGEVYDTTGLAGRGSIEGLAVASPKVEEATRQSDGANVLIISGKDREEKDASVKAVIEEPKEAKARRTAQRRRTSSAARQGNAMRDQLYERLRAIGLNSAITLKAVNTLTGQGKDGKPVPIEGTQAGRVITVALDGDNPTFTLNHEVIHALRDSSVWGGKFGLFREAEWQELVKNARRDKRAMADAKRDYPDLSAAARIEEVIANQYAAWADRKTQPTSQLARLFRRIRGAIEAVRAVFNDNGFIRSGHVFAAIESGEIAERGLDLGLGGQSGAVKYRRKAGDKLVSKIIDAAANAATTATQKVKRAPGATMDAARYVKARANREGLSNALTDSMNAGQGGEYSILGLVPGRALFSELGKYVTSSRRYLRAKENMDALRNDWHSQTDAVAQEWRKLIARDPDANKRMMDLMHRATIAQIDPAGRFAAGGTKLYRDMAGNLSATAETRAFGKAKLDEINRRRGVHNDLRAEFEALPRAYRDLYRTVRDKYRDLADAHEDAVLRHIEKNAALSVKRAQAKHDKRMIQIELQGLEGDEKAKAIAEADELLAQAKKRGGWTKKAKIAGLRAQFEANRLKGPYFPLSRFGEYFVVLRNEKGDVESFSKFETQREQKAFIDAAKEEGLTAQHGVLSNAGELRGVVDPAFIADVQEILGEAGADNKLMDDVWQRWLETLPTSSIRTNRIHRKARAGFNTDAFRAFGKQMFHGSHQLARLEHSVDLEDALEDMRAEAEKAPDSNRAALVVNEMARRHEFTMNPTSASWSTTASSLAFVWYLSVTPAAAAVNISQTTVIGTPLLAAAFKEQGVSGAAKALGKAMSDFTRGRGHVMESKRLTAGEKRALNEAYRRGTVDKTQAHDLAGVAETGVEYSAFRAKWMARISWFFHHAERMNREVTFLAAYRMARADGTPQKEAIDKAADLTWKVHFDYQNSSRPRLMHNDTAKVLLIFRNFTINMLWRLFRDSHQALRGATPKERREARSQLLGVTGSMMLHAGITGTWGYGIIMSIAGLFFQGGDDEAEERLKGMLAGDGEGFAGKVRQNIAGVALKGLPGHALGISLSERLGMPNLWFRDSFRNLEGREWYAYMLGELVGPVPSIAEGMIHGTRTALDGDIVRGAESAVPKFMRDQIRAARYLKDGVTTRNGDPIVDEVTMYQAIVQALGFTPAQIAERYEVNSRMMNIQTIIQERRRDIMKDLALTAMAGKTFSEEQMEELRAFNVEYPEYPITTQSLKRSISGRQRAKSRNEFGVQLNPKLNDRIREDVAATLYN